MSDTTARLSLPTIAPSQAQKHVTHNEALQMLDGITQLVLSGVDADTPPITPDPGALFALGAAPTGAWAGQAGALAQWVGPAWHFLTPQEGWLAWDRSGTRLVVHQGGAWSAVPIADLQNLEGVGIGTGWDNTNRLSVAADAALLSHDGAGHQLKINKAGAGETGSLLYQSNWTGHAEIGLTGDNDFHLKVSANGSAWTEALTVDAQTGLLSGAAVQSDPEDGTPGRLMAVGAFGLGGSAILYGASDDLNDLPPNSHFFRFDAGSSLPANTPFDGFGAGYQIYRSNSLRIQVVHQFSGSNNANTYMRSRTSEGWGPWVLSYDQSTILGSVSQVAGEPTGALVERGSNANGEYVRFADGTQFCTNSNAAITTAPAPFAGPITKIDGDKLWIGTWF